MENVRDLFSLHAGPVQLWGGVLIGVLFGAILQATGFCAMGGVADWRNFGDTRRLRAWLLAAAVATLAAQALDALGIVALGRSMYLAPRLDWAGHLGGGFLFGIGMVLAGGCASRNVVRAGAGDLRSALTLVVLGIAAFMTIGGALGPARAALENTTAVDLTGFGLASQSLADIVVRATGMAPDAARVAAAGFVGGGLALWCLSSPAFRRSRLHVLSGIGVGLCIAAGWALTGLAYDEMAARPSPPASLTFVRPTGDALDWLQRATALGLPGFGVATMTGTLLGAFAVARATGRARLATFADTGDTLRNMAGAVLMGVGGVMGLGCTIGQGVTGVSTLAAGALLTLTAIIAGGMAGLKLLDRIA